jgi:hypothetical protein
MGTEAEAGEGEEVVIVGLNLLLIYVLEICS